jgi:flagellar biosynthesis protein FlhB
MAEKGLQTELPTEKRLREAVEQGNFAKTPDIQTVCMLSAALAVVSMYGKQEAQSVAEIWVGIFSGLAKYQVTPEAVRPFAIMAALTMMKLITPMCTACAGAAIVGGGLQSRFRLSPKVIELNLERLNPVNGFQRLFSMQSSVKVGTDALKMAFVGTLLWQSMHQILSDPLFYTPVQVDRLGSFIATSFKGIISRSLVALGGIAALNFVYQLRKVRSDLMMTKQEVKDENKQAEGDPRLRMLRRAMGRRMAQKQMLSAVPTADVVVTNPTHFAVALKYQRGVDKAPIVLAKGEKMFARRIKALAAEHEVPMVENRPVARMLFKYGKVGKPIPNELYKAVAEILAFVYKTHRYYFHQLKSRRSTE